jgi:hypothetical protein
MSEPGEDRGRRQRQTQRIPTGSVFYERIIPVLLAALAVITILFILIAAGVLLGIITYQ